MRRPNVIFKHFDRFELKGLTKCRQLTVPDINDILYVCLMIFRRTSNFNVNDGLPNQFNDLLQRILHRWNSMEIFLTQNMLDNIPTQCTHQRIEIIHIIWNLGKRRCISSVFSIRFKSMWSMRMRKVEKILMSINRSLK